MAFTPTMFTKDGETVIAATPDEAVWYKYDGWTQVGVVVPPDGSDYITAVRGDLKLYIPLTSRGVANGVASLGPDGLVPAAQLPAGGGAGGGGLTLAGVDANLGGPSAGLLDSSGKVVPAKVGDLSATYLLKSQYSQTTPTTDAGALLTGTLALARLPGLPASQVTSGTFAAARIPDLSSTYTTVARVDPTTTGTATTFLTALARAEARLGSCNVVTLGDSITEGTGSSLTELRYASMLKDALQSVYAGGNGGRGFIPALRGGGSLAEQFTFTGTPTKDLSTANPNGLGRRAITLASGQTASITTFGDYVGVMYTGTAGAIKVTIDGVVSTIPAATGADLGTTGRLWKSAALTYGPHTVTIEPNTTTAITLDGVVEWDQDFTAGVTFWDSGHAGAKANDFDGVATNSARWADALPAVNPHLVLIALGTNDARQSDKTTYSPTTYGDRLGRIVDLIRAKATTAPSIAFVLQPQPVTSATDWATYMATAAAVAATKGVMVLDLQPRVPANTVDGASDLNFDALHPNDAGHSLYADALFMLLTGGRRPSVPAAIRQYLTNSNFNTVATVPETPSIGRVACRVKVGASGRLHVTMSARMKVTPVASANVVWGRIQLSGANTRSATTVGTGGLYMSNSAEVSVFTADEIIEGLTPGETWVDLLVGTNGTSTTGTFDDTRIIARPL